jgi:hypothetical protein
VFTFREVREARPTGTLCISCCDLTSHQKLHQNRNKDPAYDASKTPVEMFRSVSEVPLAIIPCSQPPVLLQGLLRHASPVTGREA